MYNGFADIGLSLLMSYILVVTIEMPANIIEDYIFKKSTNQVKTVSKKDELKNGF